MKTGQPRDNAPLLALTTTDYKGVDLMADTIVNTASEAENPSRFVTDLALEVQVSAREAAHLIKAIDEAVDDLACGGIVANPAHIDALDRVMVFCGLAKKAARRASEYGEKIEVAGRRLTRESLGGDMTAPQPAR